MSTASVYSVNSGLFAEIVSRHENSSEIPLQALLYAWAVSMIDNNNLSVKNTARESDANAKKSVELNELLTSVQDVKFQLPPDKKATDSITYASDVYQAVIRLGFEGGSIDPANNKPTITVGKLESLIETIKTKIDSLSNTTQKTQLRLQQVIGTLNTGTETSSNMMTKIFSGLERITSNIGR